MKQLALLVLLALMAGWGDLVLAAEPPDLINYQGVLRDSSGQALDGTYGMVFRFFNAETGGDEVLVDTHAAVTVSGGLFNVALGSGSVTDGPGPGEYTRLSRVFADYPELYLQVQVGGETLLPRARVVSAGYAMNARYVNGIEVAGGPIDLYVDAVSGSDANSGILPTAAKRTIQAAINRIPTILTGVPTVHIADGSYHETLILDRRIRHGFYPILLTGNEVAPQNVVLDGQSILETGLLILNPGVVVSGITFRDFDDAIEIQHGGLEIRDCAFWGNDEAIDSENSSVEVFDTTFSWNRFGIDAFGSDIRIGTGTFTENAIAINVWHSLVWMVDEPSSSLQVTGNNQGILGFYSQISTGAGTLNISNNGTGITAARYVNVDLQNAGELTILNNEDGDMIATSHSLINGYGGGATGSCEAEPGTSHCLP